MITFRETLDGLQNVSELLKTAMEAEGAVQRNLASLADLRAMLESPRVRKATGPLEVRDYVERVVLPQLTGLHDSLQIGTDDSFKRLRAASDQAERLIVRLQMLVDGSVDGLL
jgi:hypothetical protein